MAKDKMVESGANHSGLCSIHERPDTYKNDNDNDKDIFIILIGIYIAKLYSIISLKLLPRHEGLVSLFKTSSVHNLCFCEVHE